MNALDLEEPTAALNIVDQPVNDDGKSRTYSGAPPPFGRALLRYFSFAPGYVNLNHGVLLLVLWYHTILTRACL
jgi:hypothetical protein